MHVLFVFLFGFPCRGSSVGQRKDVVNVSFEDFVQFGTVVAERKMNFEEVLRCRRERVRVTEEIRVAPVQLLGFTARLNRFVLVT